MEGELSAPAEEKTAVAPSPTYCVTGATGYIGSWLVKLLLERGYKVHATVRNPENAVHLLSLWNGDDQLRLFKADLLEEGSFDEAVNGCNGVFHVAASMEFEVNSRENIESYVRSNIIEPAIKGTENLLKSCLKSDTVKRVVFTSSISTITANDSNGDRRSVVDESCQTTFEHVLNAKASGWVYVLSKLLTEEAAFKFANENGIDLVSVITTTVAGPFLTTTVPSSIQVLLSPVTGDPKYSSILSAVNARMGSVALVHIEDICRAHIFLMEQARAEGKYMCCFRSCRMSELINRLARENLSSNIQRLEAEEESSKLPEISSKKLRDLGFTYKHDIEDIIHQAITACVDFGFLPRTRR
ncbi:Translation protein SH3-like family protein [Hibiscus syriacus]|uniref:Translation protein SH3-like family protein n=1 Tax=Hibiscus syriacus TaxID=106335 RepID=A0A6A2YNZ7_HIBSY|nr:putative anthocyanidin reductase [Hibiscus syriacus]XP_039025652.1 putative anthocyanidin reductase [Hibiscus syriacus]KAE8681043.1 Translation protein SH3-like family protein [Hibiscus syriacus]